jgi:hypothetical protein
MLFLESLRIIMGCHKHVLSTGAYWHPPKYILLSKVGKMHVPQSEQTVL